MDRLCSNRSECLNSKRQGFEKVGRSSKTSMSTSRMHTERWNSHGKVQVSLLLGSWRRHDFPELGAHSGGFVSPVAFRDFCQRNPVWSWRRFTARKTCASNCKQVSLRKYQNFFRERMQKCNSVQNRFSLCIVLLGWVQRLQRLLTP